MQGGKVGAGRGGAGVGIWGKVWRGWGLEQSQAPHQSEKSVPMARGDCSDHLLCNTSQRISATNFCT